VNALREEEPGVRNRWASGPLLNSRIMKRNMELNEINKWPNSWEGIREDVEYGHKIVKLMKPFIKQLLDSSYSPKTTKEHIDNLWLLGGHIIKHINFYEEDRNKDSLLLLTRFIDSFDGPTISDLSEYEQISFDRTCRKFYKYLVQNELNKV